MIHRIIASIPLFCCMLGLLSLEGSDDVVMTDSEQKICYFTVLPVELRNRIAQYLEFKDRESEEEFVQRTRTYGRLSREHARLTENVIVSHHVFGMSFLGFLSTYSVDLSKIIMFERWYTNKGDNNPIATVIDISRNAAQQNIQFAPLIKMDYRQILCIAFSRDATYFAELEKYRVVKSTIEEHNSWAHRLVVQKVSQPSLMQKFDISNHFDNFVSIGFNKQGTEIIVHATTDMRYTGLDKFPISFYEKISVSTQKEHEEKSVKTFDEFLRQHQICKPLTPKEKQHFLC